MREPELAVEVAAVDTVLQMASSGVRPLPKPALDDVPRSGWYERRTYPPRRRDGRRRAYLFYRWKHRGRVLSRNLGRLDA